MQEGNWRDIEKLFQKTYLYLYFVIHYIINNESMKKILRYLK